VGDQSGLGLLGIMESGEIEKKERGLGRQSARVTAKAGSLCTKKDKSLRVSNLRGPGEKRYSHRGEERNLSAPSKSAFGEGAMYGALKGVGALREAEKSKKKASYWWASLSRSSSNVSD